MDLKIDQKVTNLCIRHFRQAGGPRVARGRCRHREYGGDAERDPSGGLTDVDPEGHPGDDDEEGGGHVGLDDVEGELADEHEGELDTGIVA